VTLGERLPKTDNQTSPALFLFPISFIWYEEQIQGPDRPCAQGRRIKIYLRSKRLGSFDFYKSNPDGRHI
jgi:hypothetical protein